MKRMMTTMKRMITTLVATTALLVVAMAGAASAGSGNGPDQLERAGWDCFSIPLGIHCTQHLDALESGEAVAVPVMVFEHGTEDFLGTELLVHDDVFNAQPCPQDGGEYFRVAGSYWACHHYETSH